MHFDECLEKISTSILDLYRRYRNEFPLYRNDGSEKWITSKGEHWMEGFYAGLLFKSYEFNKNDEFLEAGLGVTDDIIELKTPVTHDIGFKFYYSAVAGYRITGDNKFKSVSLKMASELADTYNPNLGVIPLGREFAAYFPGESPLQANNEFIIDAMMASVPLLLWAWSMTSETKYYYLSYIHSMKTFDLLVKQDFGSYQAASLDVPSLSLKKHTHQGSTDESTWSRGQAWAIYGFLEMYKHTGFDFFKNVSLKMSDYFINNLPPDYIPSYDFSESVNSGAARDTSAAAIAGSAIVQLSLLTGNRYLLDKSIKIARALTSVDYFSSGRLLHSRYREDQGKDSEIVFGDYYLAEMLLELNRNGINE